MTLRTVATSTLLGLAALVVVFALDLALLLFGAVLVAVVLSGAANRLARLTHLSRGRSMALVVLALIGLFTLIVWLAIPAITGELAQLQNRLPEAMQQLQDFINKFEWLETLITALPSSDALTLSRPGVAGRVTTALSSTMGSIVNLAIVLMVGLYLAADPCPYVNGAVRMFPLKHRARAREVLDALGDVLFAWLQGQLLSMVIVGVVITTGLWLLDIPLAGTLGLIAGLFEFVPNIGPIVAGIPAALLALTVSPTHVLYVVILYSVVQTLEGYLLTPFVMRRAVALPPALTIVAQLVGALTAGWVGLLLATPLVAVVVVLVQKVYLESILGEQNAAAG